MALAAFADIAAATTAGYIEIVNVGTDGVTTVTLEKRLTGDPDGGGGVTFRAYGRGASQATAETQALSALNFKRGTRYGFDTGATSKGKGNNNSHTRDVT